MSRIPRSVHVARALRALRREIKAAVSETNNQVAKRLSRGDYAAAQEMIDMAQSLSTFEREIASLQSRWKEVRFGGKAPARERNNATPLWEFYQPILESLVALGGTGTREEIERQLEGMIEGRLKQGDFATNSRGVPRWRVLVGRARKHMVAEGFLVDEKGREWKISKKGEQAAKPPQRN